uniref:Ciliogenesis and planar polarity effector 2 n=1 Tax=Molossus molossus TaxID=27622 RepID=A0A7J8F7K7_MOLMO|nr:ciliogenesis and planar polarity effector 2 [Molossus molossus]
MARPPAPGSVIVPDWHESAEGKEYLACILRKNRRRVFGLLERPVLPPAVAVDTASYKIFVSGKSGVGKTALVAKLAGLEVPVVHHETTGIQTTVVFWPAKLQVSDRVVMFRFEFWDCGESALKKFDHMLPACMEKTDAFLLLFSFTDRASFEDLPGQLTRIAGGDEGGFGVSAPCVHSETQALRPSTHGFPVCPGTSLCSELTNECNSWYSSCTSSPGWCLKCQPPWLPR